MCSLPAALMRLARRYEETLFHGPLATRFAHHLALVAPETWLAMELAFLVHTEGDQLGLAGWTALLERARVDVTLVPPDFTESALPQGTCYLELKLVNVRYWNTAWRDVVA